MKLTGTVQGVFSGLATASKNRFNRQNVRNAWNRLRKFWSNEWNSVSHRRLYAATAVASFTLFGVTYTAIDRMHGTQAWEQVYSNGTYVGMVPNSDEVVGAMKRIALGYHVDVRFTPVNMHVSDSYDWKSVASLPTRAAAITLNGQPLLYTSSTEGAAEILNTLKSTLAPRHLGDNAKVAFVGNVGIEPSVASVTDILTPDAALHYLLHPSQSRLSARGMSFSDIALGPALKAEGAQNSLPPLLTVSISQVVTKNVSLPYDTHYVSDSHLGVGAVKVTTPGKNGVAQEQVQLNYVNGQLVSQTVLSKQVVQQPKNAVATKGTNPGVAVGGWGWPCASYTITSGYGWRFGGAEFHPGIDIGCPIGTPVYATNNGRIEDAGWNSGGYGIWIRIQNGGGMETIFGHLSRVAVHSGQLVSKGQLIGYSGATGEATGPHLHYEVRLNGRHIDPHPYM